MFNTIQDAISWLEIQVKFKPKTDLERMREAYRDLNLNLSDIKKIHVAGTNGKGSVCSYLSHILMEAGYKVGTYTSPYLVRFNERIRINMHEIEDDTLLPLINQIYAFNEEFGKRYGEKLSFFELLTLMSMIHYQNEAVDVMVMEVGLGGLLDATNVLNYDLSIIASIGFDHMKQLGNTLESISFNKLGILKPGNHLITAFDSNLHGYFKGYCDARGVDVTFLTPDQAHVISDDPLVYIYKNETYRVSLKGSYQILNSMLAIEGIKSLFPDISVAQIQQGLKKTLWSGRLEEIDYHVFIDGAHNTHAMDALKDVAKTTFKDHPIWVLFSALGDKDIKGMLDIVKTFSEKIVITTFPDPRFQDLSEIAKDYPFIQNPMNAIEKLKKDMPEHTVLIITGSLHFIGYIKKQYKRTC